MNDNRGQTIFLSVIGIATLLVAIIGATFAYFTTQMSGDAATVTGGTGTIGKMTQTVEALTFSKILPGYTSDEKTATVALSASDYPVNYTCTFKVTGNTIGDMYLNVKGDNVISSANGTSLNKIAYADPDTGTAAGTPQEIQIASGTLNGGESATLTYSVTFKETGTSQDESQSATIDATVYCSLESTTVYYNNDNQSGTTTAPSAQ